MTENYGMYSWNANGVFGSFHLDRVLENSIEERVELLQVTVRSF